MNAEEPGVDAGAVQATAVSAAGQAARVPLVPGKWCLPRLAGAL